MHTRLSSTAALTVCSDSLQVAIMLSRLYKVSCTTALKYTQALHDTRRYPQNVRSPQTAVQRAQVCRLPGLGPAAAC